MKLRNVIGLLVVIIFCSCIQQTVKNKQQTEPNINQQNVIKNGLLIENGINRGLAFTDSLGDKYAITYISINVANTDTVPVNFEFSLASEYNHPLATDREKYTLVLLSEEWTLDGVTISDSLINKIPNYLKQRKLNKTLKPGEETIFAIGTLRPSPAKICVVLPNELFLNDRSNLYTDCDWQMNKRNTTNSQIEIGLKLDYSDKKGESTNCIIIPCGRVSYL